MSPTPSASVSNCEPFIIQGRPSLDETGQFELTEPPGLAGELSDHLSGASKGGRSALDQSKAAEARRLHDEGKWKFSPFLVAVSATSLRAAGSACNDVSKKCPNGFWTTAQTVHSRPEREHSGPVRPHEVYEMRWKYMQLDRCLYHNPKGKSKRARRMIPVFREAMEVLRRRHVAQGRPREGWVFPADSRSGHVVTIRRAFTNARRKAQLPDAMVLYTARHGQATDLGSIVSTKELMDIGGWSDAATAMCYQHPDTAALQSRLEAARTTGKIR